MDNIEFQSRAEEVDRLVQRVSALEDQEARTAALDLLQASMDFHGAALSRIVEILSEAGEAGRSLLAKLGADPLICGLLVLYGIHPVALEDRIAGALKKIAPQLRKQNAAAELLRIEESVVRIRIKNSGHGCGSSSAALKPVVQQAILEAAPEVAEIVVDGLSESDSSFVPLSALLSADKKKGNYEESTA